MFFSLKEKKKVEDRFEIIIGKEQEGARLDVVLSLSMEEISRSRIQKLIEEGMVEINDQPCLEKKHPVRAGELITVQVPAPSLLEVEAEDIPLEILYEDQDLMVINKARGLVVHPGAGNEKGTLVNAIMHHCGDSLSSINGIIRPGIVHRIDKDTSGLLMIAKNDRAHQSLAKQLADHSITRVYHAIVYNNLKEDSGTIDRPIGRDPKNRLRQGVTDPERGRRAVTHYRVLERLGPFTYIEATLETGRTHQIRVHMAYINHPLLGDPVYGPKRKYPGVEGQMLHAKKLGFRHPVTGLYMEFDSELPEDFQKVLRKLRERK
jgi:23S rRNA pseudouridine1911/1915/1917 synthase